MEPYRSKQTYASSMMPHSLQTSDSSLQKSQVADFSFNAAQRSSNRKLVAQKSNAIHRSQSLDGGGTVLGTSDASISANIGLSVKLLSVKNSEALFWTV